MWNDLFRTAGIKSLLTIARHVATTKITCPLLDLGIIKTSFLGNELHILMSKKTGRNTEEHSLLDESNVFISKM